MKATGIVRRIDDLGRVVIPKEIRRTMRIREGDPLEIFTDANGGIVFKKYSPMGELSLFASQYAEVLHKVSGLPTMICDRDHVIAVAGMPKKEILERRVTPPLEDMMNQRKSFQKEEGKLSFQPVEGVDRQALACVPIVGISDLGGAVLFLDGDGQHSVDGSQMKLIQAAAMFLGKQVES